LKFSEQQGVGAGLQSRDHDDTYPQHNNTIKSKSNTTKAYTATFVLHTVLFLSLIHSVTLAIDTEQPFVKHPRTARGRLLDHSRAHHPSVYENRRIPTPYVRQCHVLLV
jgi:hypothetical protein